MRRPGMGYFLQAYRTQHLPERKKMMQQWADYLDGLKEGAVVIPFKTVKV